MRKNVYLCVVCVLCVYVLDGCAQRKLAQHHCVFAMCVCVSVCVYVVYMVHT